MQNEYYIHKLYPLQDKVLRQIETLETSFYLTGGTALSRFYFHHRYSDDLDFFMNASPNFSDQGDRIINHIKTLGWNLKVGARSESYYRLFVTEDDTTLKIDLVNDVPYRNGNPIPTSLFKSTDSILNITSNKISALSRNEPRDFADLVVIARNVILNWRTVVEDAKEKDLDVDEMDRANLIAQFKVERLNQVNWCIEFDLVQAKEDLKLISRELLLGTNNSLCKKPL